MDSQPEISVVIPIYNEIALIDRLHAAVVETMDSIGRTWEVLYVDDGSTDGSLQRLLELTTAEKRVRVIELSRNWGHQPAVSAGLAHTRGAAAVLMDGDLQDPPAVIPALVEAWQAGAQIVVAQRSSRGERGLRRLVYPLFYRLLGFLSDYPIPLNAGIFGLLDRQPVDAINRLHEANRFLPGLRAWVGYRTAVVAYDRPDRLEGQPKQTFGRLLRYGLDAIFSFSYKPLRLSLLLGLCTALAAMVYGTLLVVCRMLGVGMFGIPVVDGYTSTIVSVLFLGGIQMVTIGILGEYVGRIYDEVKRRPLFLVQQVHGADGQGSGDDQGS